MRDIGVAVPLALLALAACVSPEEQRAMDQKHCAGFGFTPGTDAMANCLMQTAQQREAKQAADARQAAHDRMVADQMRQQREQAQRAADAMANRQHQADVMRMMNAPSPGISSPGSAHCTSVTAGNAGSLTCR